jgi:hypothetical protein
MADSRPWTKGHRLIPSRFPPVELYERILDPHDLEAAYQLEALTNPRLLEQAGKLALIAPEDRVCGEGSSAIMAAFTHTGSSSRFTDGTYGVYYAGNSLDVAIAETVFHKERFLRNTQEPDTRLAMREYISETVLPLEDIRDQNDLHFPDINTYAFTQEFAIARKKAGSNGLLYKSVRYPGGECIACFKPKVLKVPVIQGAHIEYFYNAAQKQITHSARLSEIATIKRG